MLDTPPLRKRRGPRLVKGRWAGQKFFSSLRFARNKTFSHYQKGYGRKR